jgi:hypothetical protein
MAVSKERILELQQIIKEDYGKEVSIRKASEIANGLVGYFDLLARLDYENKNAKRAKGKKIDKR